MRTILVVAVLCFAGALALTDEQRAQLTELRGICIRESDVDPQAVDNAKEGNIDDSNEKLACFTFCMLKKIGIMDEDGNFNEVLAKEKAPDEVPQEQIDEVVNKCKDTTGDNKCDTAIKLVKCFKENKAFTVLD